MRREADGTVVEHADLGSVATFHCNDMLVDEAGGAYVGNFGFDLDGALATMGPDGLLTTMITDRAPYTAVLAKVEPDGSVMVAADDLAFPNGVVTVDSVRLRDRRARRTSPPGVYAPGSDADVAAASRSGRLEIVEL